MNDLDQLLGCAREAAAGAATILLRRPGRVDHKGPIDLVTEVDFASEAAIRATLARLTPDIPVQGEETGGRTDGLRWVVDPLDGTTNYVHDYPAYVVSIALVDGDVPLVGVIADPVRGRTCAGRAGGGATVDGAPLRVSDARELDDTLGVTGFAYDRREHAGFYLLYVERVLRYTQGMRRSGSAAFDLATVAEGRADFFWEFGLKAWDTAAGVVLVREAGGEVTGLRGERWRPGDRGVLATNGHLHRRVVDMFADLPLEPVTQ